jgi:hypothetical protein
MQLIIFGVKQMDSRMDIMKAADLLIKRNELMAFFSIAGNRETCDRKLKTPLGFDGRCDDGVVSENLFDLVGIGRLAPDADTGSAVKGEFGTAEAECIGCFAYQG